MERAYYDQLINLVDTKNYRPLKEELISLNEADIAIFIESLEDIKAIAVLRILPKNIAIETFSFLSQEKQEKFLDLMSSVELTSLLENLYIDDLVDMLEELPDSIVVQVLKHASKERRMLINQFLQYKEDSAGSIMTSDFVNVSPNYTIGQALKSLRQQFKYIESIYTIYVTDDKLGLIGYLDVKDLLLKDPSILISDVMHIDIITVSTDTDQEDVARVLSKYDLVSVPVTDKEFKLVGIVTIDDALDVLEEEATEDIHKIAAISPTDKPYLEASILSIAKSRVGWLLFLMLSAIFTGVIIEKYEVFLVSISGLMAFVPMFTDTGGNAGSQSSTLVIRGLSLNEIRVKDYIKVLIKELGVGLITGLALAIVNFIRIVIIHPGDVKIALVVSLTLIATVVMSKTIGGLLPLLAKALRLDPAVMAAPLITTIVDSLSLIIYFNIVKIILM